MSAQPIGYSRLDPDRELVGFELAFDEAERQRGGERLKGGDADGGPWRKERPYEKARLRGLPVGGLVLVSRGRKGREAQIIRRT